MWTTRSLGGETAVVEGWFLDDLEKKRLMSYYCSISGASGVAISLIQIRKCLSG